MHRNQGLRFAVTAAAFILVLALLAGCAGGAAPGVSATPVAAKPASEKPAAEAKPAAEKAAAFANPDLLVETSWLSQRLDDAAIRIIDARTADEYKAGHVKGAVSVPVEDTFNPTGPKQMAGPTDQIEKLFSAKGISGDTRVIVYDNGKETKASRVLWTLELFGHSKVAVLNGGFKKWQKDSLPVATEETKVAAAKFTAKSVPALNATKEDVLAAIKKPGFAIVDSRSPEEYRGEDLRTKRGGHIPGAVNIDWRDLFTAGDAPVLKSPAELAKMYESAGVTKDKEIIVHCQTGQRSAVSYLTLKLLGYAKVRNYDGSWQEWGNETETPIEK